MFEDKRFSNNDELNKNRFFMPEDNTGLNDGNQNLNFQQQTTYVPEPEPIARKPRKQVNYKPIIISLIVVLVLGVILGTFFVVKEVMSSPIKVYTKAIEEGYTLLNDYLKEKDRKALNYDVNVDTLSSIGTLKMESNIPTISSLNGINVSYKTVIDVHNEQMDLNLNIGELIDLKSYLRDKKIFVGEKNIFDKWLEVGDLNSFNIESLKTDVDSNDILNVVKVVKNYINSNLNKDNVVKEKDVIKVNEVDVKVTSNVYVIPKETLEKHIKEIIKELQNDANAVESLGDLLHKSKRDTENMLKNLGKDEELFENLGDLTFRIYTKGLANSFVGLSIDLGKYEVFSFGMLKDIKELNFYTNTFEVRDLINNQKHDITLISYEEKLASIGLEQKEDKTIVDLDINLDGIQVKGNLNYEVKRVGDKRKTEVVDLDLVTNIAGSQLNFKVNVDNMIQVGTKLDNVSIDLSKNIKNLSDEEIKTIQDNMQKVMADTPLFGIYEMVNNIIEQKRKDLCAEAFDCECENGTCECSYLDGNEQVKNITCSE